jgi:hypothetical protein
MKYLLLLNNSAEQWQQWRTLPADEGQKLREQEMPRWNALFGWAGEQGIEVSGLQLEDPGEARVVQVRDGETVVSDGPYTETKEVIGGYFLAECKDLDQAIELAQRVPVVDQGSVEIRPVVTN